MSEVFDTIVFSLAESMPALGLQTGVRRVYNTLMALMWDYDEKELQKTEAGRIMILARLINYGPTRKGEKIPLKLVKKYWNKLDIYPEQRRLLELLIWGKYRSLPGNNDSFSIK